MSSEFISLAPTGFALGWSVAWPPGPINAEAIRRGLSHRPWSAYAVVFGGCCGDALWALSIGIGTSAFRRAPYVQTVLGVASAALLLTLGGLFLRGAFRRWRVLRRGQS